ncbi:MAG: hypothetical protein B6D61_13170 [Bacteroidetes bacterium 4484_249]|nr:MAG: hypothetical protein B6D61_13170 [Bacteroidetes bacterium 4484_249]
MKNIFFILTLAFLVGCSSHGNLKIINKTEHLLYFSINDISGTIPANQTNTISLYTGKKYIFNSPTKVYSLYLEGETFLMYDGIMPVKNTKITLMDDKTVKVYANPTNACLKVKNNTNQPILDMSYQKIYPDSICEPIILEKEIAPQITWYKQVPYSSEADSFDIRFFYMKIPPDTIYTNALNLKLDQLFLLEVN